MEGERHLVSNHADIEASINNATEHFLFEESFRSPRPRRFLDSSSGLWETFIFLLFPRRIINVIKGKVGESISTIIAIMTPSSSEFGMTATTAIGWGQEEGMDEDTAM